MTPDIDHDPLVVDASKNIGATTEPLKPRRRARSRGGASWPARIAGIATLVGMCIPVTAFGAFDGGEIDWTFARTEASGLVITQSVIIAGDPVPVDREGDGAFSVTTASDAVIELVQWPLTSRDATVTDDFGPRLSPCSGCSSNHRGVDFAEAAGTPVGALASGVVVSAEAQDSGGLGVHVVLEHEIDGRIVQSVYAHLEAGSVTVQVGESVHVGDRVGSVGTTGASTGPHLHLEVLVDGTHVDPLSFLFRYADGRDVEITDRPDLPWVPSGDPDAIGEGEGWTPDQAVAEPPLDEGVPAPAVRPDPAPVTTDPVETIPAPDDPNAVPDGNNEDIDPNAPPEEAGAEDTTPPSAPTAPGPLVEEPQSGSATSGDGDLDAPTS